MLRRCWSALAPFRCDRAWRPAVPLVPPGHDCASASGSRASQHCHVRTWCDNGTMNNYTTTHDGVPASSASISNWRGRYGAGLLAFIAVPFLLAGCGSMSQAAGGYNHDNTCPDNTLITILDFDLTASGRDEAVLAERLDDAQIEIERTGDCGGRLIAGAHSNSSAATVTLLDIELHPEGATEIARDRKLGPLVDDTMEQLRSEIDTAMDRLPADGSDLTAAVRFVADQASRHASDDTTIDVTIYTDAISNVGPLALNEPAVTLDDAARTAEAAPDPATPGINELRIEGVGHVAGTNQPPSDFVEVITAQAHAYLDRTGATHTDALTALVSR